MRFALKRAFLSTALLALALWIMLALGPRVPFHDDARRLASFAVLHAISGLVAGIGIGVLFKRWRPWAFAGLLGGLVVFGVVVAMQT